MEAFGENSKDLVGLNVLTSFVTFLICYLVIFKGAKLVSYVVYVTATIPVVLLVILAIIGVSQEGSGAGLTF